MTGLGLAGAAPAGTELDLDSLDFLSLVEGVCANTGVTIPERDYGRLGSISRMERVSDRAIGGGRAGAEPGDPEQKSGGSRTLPVGQRVRSSLIFRLLRSRPDVP